MRDFISKLGDQLYTLALHDEIARESYAAEEYSQPFDEADEKDPGKVDAYAAADAAIRVLKRYQDVQTTRRSAIRSLLPKRAR